MEGSRFGRYTIHEELGRGGMGTVYRAHDSHRRHDVALKLLPRAFLHDPAFRERFEREARTLTMLEHAAIVPVYDFGDEDGQPFIAMRLMRGGALKERLARGPLPLPAVDAVLRRIAAALDKAHQQNIVHRDLKPGNILFDEDGQAYLADFGIARLVEGTKTVTMVGTPQYMAPEQATGDTIDRRTDVYQLGVVLFEMLTGKVPYDAPTPVSLLFKHTHEPVPSARAVNGTLPHGAEVVVQRAMAKEKQRRYATTGALAQDVSALAAGRPLPSQTATVVEGAAAATGVGDPTYRVPGGSAPPPVRPSAPPTQVESAPGGRGAPLWLIGLLLAVIVVGLGVIAWQLWPRPAAETEPALALPTVAVAPTTIPSATPPPTATATATPAPTATAVPPTPTAALPTPTRFGLTAALGGGGGRMAYASDVDSAFAVYTANLDGSDARKVTDVRGDAYSPVWSPDGERLAFHALLDDHWEVFTIRADGSGLENVTRSSADDSFPDWSPDGRFIAFHSNRATDFELYIANADGSGTRAVTANDVDDFAADWSPDGRRLAFDRRVGSVRHVFTITVDGVVEQRLTTAGSNQFPDWSPDGNRLAFMSNRDGNWEIYTMQADGSDQRRLTDSAADSYYPTWSPDGQWIAFHEQTDGENRELFVIRADGSETRRLTNSAAREWQPDWQPPPGLVTLPVVPPPVAATSTPACPTVGGPFAAVWPLVQDDIGCARGGAVRGLIAIEEFVGGLMVWREPYDTGQALVLLNNGTWRVERHAPFVEGSPEFACVDANTPAQCPPTPKRGFGTIWCDNGGVRSDLGNALTCETGYTDDMQQFERGFLVRDGRGATLVLVGTTSGRWERR